MTDERQKLIEILNNASMEAETGAVDPMQIIAETRQKLTKLKRELAKKHKPDEPLKFIENFDFVDQDQEDDYEKCPDCGSRNFHNEFFDDGKGHSGTGNVCDDCGCCFDDDTEDF